MTYRRVIATSDDFGFACLATLHADGGVSGRTFGHRCDCTQRHAAECVQRLLKRT
jgi:hypothetical protein